MFLPGGNYSGPSVDPSSPPTMPSPDLESVEARGRQPSRPRKHARRRGNAATGPGRGTGSYVRSLPEGPASQRTERARLEANRRSKVERELAGSGGQREAWLRTQRRLCACLHRGWRDRIAVARQGGDARGRRRRIERSGLRIRGRLDQRRRERVRVRRWNSPRQGAGRLESGARQARRVGAGNREPHVRVDVRDDHRTRHGARRLRTERARAPRVMRSRAQAGVVLAAALVVGALSFRARPRRSESRRSPSPATSKGPSCCTFRSGSRGRSPSRSSRPIRPTRTASSPAESPTRSRTASEARSRASW